MRARKAIALLGMALAHLSVLACQDKAKVDTTASTVPLPGGLTPELAAKTVAQVGDQIITLGEYAAVLEQMDRFERLRYQTPERRKALLDQIIKAELLAGEARSRGLDKLPETEARLRQILRSELIGELRKDLPDPGDVPIAEVRAYYDTHADEFSDPERRRVSEIVLKSEAESRQVLKEALKATPMEWGRLAQTHSVESLPKPSPTEQLEVAGDLGVVSAPGNERGANPRVPPEIRKALFEIPKVGEVYPKVVKVGDTYRIVRMTGQTDARHRSFEEAEQGIRVNLVQQALRDREDALEVALRAKYPVEINEAALATVPVPADPGAVPTPPSPAPSGGAPGERAAPPAVPSQKPQ